MEVTSDIFLKLPFVDKRMSDIIVPLIIYSESLECIYDL